MPKKTFRHLPRTPNRILLVEDNEGDQLLTRKSLAKARVPHELFIVSTGMEALDFLRRRGPHTEAPRPDLILLDLNLPELSGMDVLQEVKKDESLRRIPVIVMTSSEAEKDLVESYTRHANSYMVKPGDPAQLRAALSSLSDFWFTHSRLAPR